MPSSAVAFSMSGTAVFNGQTSWMTFEVLATRMGAQDRPLKTAVPDIRKKMRAVVFLFFFFEKKKTKSPDIDQASTAAQTAIQASLPLDKQNPLPAC